MATDHLLDELDLSRVGTVTGEDVPTVGLFADEERDLLALRSDVPLSGSAIQSLAPALADGSPDTTSSPSSRPASRPPASSSRSADVRRGTRRCHRPARGGLRGPACSLLDEVRESSLDAPGLVVETDPRSPDPEGAHALADVEVDTERLVERTDEIVEQRERLAQRIRRADTAECSQASGIRMYQ